MNKRSEWFQCLAMAALLAVGAGVVWGFVAGWAMSDVEQAVNSSRVHESLVFTRDGTPIIESYTVPSYQLRSFRTLDGKSVEEPENGWSSSSTLGGPDYLSKRFAGLRWQERIILVSVDRTASGTSCMTVKKEGMAASWATTSPQRCGSGTSAAAA